MRIFSDIKSYTSDVTSLIWNFILHRDAYPENAKLAVQPELMVNVIDDPEQCHYCDFYDINLFISRDSEGKPVPNSIAIKNMASRYYQVG